MTLIVRIALIVGILWFIPWVWAFYCGAVIYFPYKPDGASRYLRVTGPLLDDNWTEDKKIPKACKEALVAAEDDRFYRHYGIDIDSIERALEKNEKLGKTRWGASTITQQLVKNAFLSRERSYLRKAREMVGAMFLDVIMSKEQQLTWYFNIVEFGPMVYGLKDAAKYYFDKKPAKLSTRECILLVSLLPSPNPTGRVLKARTSSKSLERRSARIARALAQQD